MRETRCTRTLTERERAEVLGDMSTILQHR